ncbi:ochratoxin A non-ribosomal peptide synthetase [Nemania sp. FL0916]|nr:ochratoxin A non-ribosomal peptide synthetase [Nemania sp. FL0916]
MSQRGLSTDFSRVSFHQAGMSQDDFGLGPEAYRHLLQEVDRIFLVAWPVNFNLPFESFKPHIPGVKHAANFAAQSAMRIPVVFISTIDTCSGWDARAKGGGPVPVPETRLEDFALPNHDLVLEDAAVETAGDFPATIIRRGQVAGSEAEAEDGDGDPHVGVWNKYEWIPSIIASSVQSLGVLPGDLALRNSVDWFPVERMVSAIFGVASAHGYFHAVNPERTTWSDFKNWVASSERSGIQDDSSSEKVSLDRNPSLKLLDFNRSIAAAIDNDRPPVIFGDKTASMAPGVFQKVRPITPQLMV